MNLEIENKFFLVTGSSRGIGLSIAQKFLEEGAIVGIVARNEDTMSKAANELIKRFGRQRVRSWIADLTNDVNVERLLQTINKEWSKLDGLIANIGNGKSSLEAITSKDQWEKVWSENFNSALYPCRAFLPMLEENRGVITLISSICGVESLGAPIDYSVAKSALISLAKNLSRKIAPGVRVNVVAPGNVYFKGGSWDKKLQSDKAQVENMIKSEVPMKRFGKPEEIADAVVFLCSERASFITGSVLRVDGGQTQSM